MNKMMKLGMVSLLSLMLCSQAMAAFTLSGTRFIYEEGRKNISVDVTNTSDQTYGGQVWIDNQSQTSGVYMVPTPPFFKLAPKQKQIVRIMKTDSGVALPADRESLFWLSVQEIPPKPEKTDEPVISIALATQVKLIYRPKVLVQGRKGAEKKVEVVQKGGSSYLKNPTPYYFAITKVKVNGQPLHLSQEEEMAVSVLAPFSEQMVKGISLGAKSVSIDAINDWGGVETYILKGDKG
ncbi:fimbrial chaperone [Escherichia coli]|uniref:fimbrial chaperone n=1 Tax=Escherichia coli TaxID=562 RepID=UPI000774EA78|nr:fimbrial chaperone [Escherichia coli]EFA8566906.1 fimbrial chaperone [Escherichia coli O157]APJ80168.1 fimbrial chaperone protein [Escherichia coli]EEZ3920470.1 fimbrial chaperone [Escherichia coli]EEZ3997387.1 fimbrial chaperone [Escherichia coli]EFC5414510.1 fimbrial chaperone [Escherichia coli]